MSRLIESIKLLDGKFYNLFYHEQRMKQSLKILYGNDKPVNLEEFLFGNEHPMKGLFKCRVLYDDISRETTFTPYEAKKIRRVKAVEDDSISYEFKYVNREPINRLFERRGDCDDVLIIRHGMVTDCSFSNIAFRKGHYWYTPDLPLLKGTMRQNLMDKNKIKPLEILTTDIRSFDAFKIINAMLEFDSPEIEVTDIVF
jgi:4-amino-4-deoxychorismate lyase